MAMEVVHELGEGIRWSRVGRRGRSLAQSGRGGGVRHESGQREVEEAKRPPRSLSTKLVGG